MATNSATTCACYYSRSGLSVRERWTSCQGHCKLINWGSPKKSPVPGSCSEQINPLLIPEKNKSPIQVLTRSASRDQLIDLQNCFCHPPPPPPARPTYMCTCTCPLK